MILKFEEITNVVKFVADKYHAINYDIEWKGTEDFFDRRSQDRTVRFDFANDKHARIEIGRWTSVYFSNTRHSGEIVPDTLLYDELRGYLDVELKRLLEKDKLEEGGYSDAT